MLRGAGHHRVWQLVFSPGDRTLAAASYHDASGWDLAHGGAGVPIPGRSTLVFTKEGKPRAAAWGDKVPLELGPKEKLLAETDTTAPGVVALWDVEQRRSRATLTGHSAASNAARFSRDGQTMATASNDRTVRLWEVAGGRSRATLTGHTGAVHCVSFSPDGQWLASGGFDKTVRLWHLAAMADSSNR
jgi:WD40 repeat protein